MEVSDYCLDTNAYSAFARGHRGMLTLVDSSRWIGLPVVVLGELEGGFGHGAKTALNRALLDAFEKEAFVHTLPVNQIVAKIYGEMYVELRKSGRPIPQNDMWIAAIAIAARVPLVTYDRHFDRVPDLVTLAPV